MNSSFRGFSLFTLFPDFVSPTKSPPTIPFKQVGPQAIPAPINAPNTDIHDIYTFHSVDQFGNPFSEMHEEIRKGSQGLVNPGASLVPHPVQLQALHKEPGGKFVGAPATSQSGIILHSSDREDDRSTSHSVSSISSDEGEVKNIPENTKDDRYQTHFVEINKDNEGHSIKHPSLAHSSLRVGEAMHGGEYAHESKNAPNNEEEAEKVIVENKNHREAMKENTREHPHDERVENEMHRPLNQDHSYLALPHSNHEQEAPQTGNAEVVKSPVVEEQASERSKLAQKPSFGQTETGTARSILPAKISPPTNQIQNGNQSSAATTNGTQDVDDIKGNMKAIGDMLKMFDKATSTLSSKIIKNANKVMIKEGRTPFVPKQSKIEPNNARTTGVEQALPTPPQPSKKEGPNLIPEAHEENKNIAVVKQMVQNLYNLTSRITNTITNNANTLAAVKKDDLGRQHDLYKNFTDHQKGAYKAWRRQALINFHERNPGKPIPRNTVSLSENSLCPKFCRLFCDPWCVKIGCCKLSQEKLDAYKEIEQRQSLLNAGNDKR